MRCLALLHISIHHAAAKQRESLFIGLYKNSSCRQRKSFSIWVYFLYIWGFAVKFELHMHDDSGLCFAAWLSMTSSRHISRVALQPSLWHCLKVTDPHQATASSCDPRPTKNNLSCIATSATTSTTTLATSNTILTTTRDFDHNLDHNTPD